MHICNYVSQIISSKRQKQIINCQQNFPKLIRVFRVYNSSFETNLLKTQQYKITEHNIS